MSDKYVYQIFWKPFTLSDTPVYLPHKVFLYRTTAEHVCLLMNEALHETAKVAGRYGVEDIRVNDK